MCSSNELLLKAVEDECVVHEYKCWIYIVNFHKIKALLQFIPLPIIMHECRTGVKATLHSSSFNIWVEQNTIWKKPLPQKCYTGTYSVQIKGGHMAAHDMTKLNFKMLNDKSKVGKEETAKVSLMSLHTINHDRLCVLIS